MLDHFSDITAGPGLPRLRYVVLRPSREETLRRAQSRTAADALVDEVPIVSLWDQFSDLGELDDHTIDTTAHHPAETLAAVQAAIASESFVLDAPPPR